MSRAQLGAYLKPWKENGIFQYRFCFSTSSGTFISSSILTFSSCVAITKILLSRCFDIVFFFLKLAFAFAFLFCPERK